MATHRKDIKSGHRDFARVLSDDKEDDEGGSSGSIKPDGLIAPFANGGLAHPLFKDSSYFQTADPKLTADVNVNAEVDKNDIPEPNPQPSLTHTPRSAPSRTPTPTMSRR